MRKFLLVAVILALLLPLLEITSRPAQAQAGDAWALISAVNALRAAYGLPPYEVDNSLMSAAQGHSNYQAQIGTWTHTGPGGSRPHDRAVAAGYGNGAQVYISENVAMGVNLSPSQIVNEVWQDAVHLETMISSRYQHIGAGVASAGGFTFYTLDVGYIAGSPGGDGNGDNPGGPSPTDVGGTPVPTDLAAIPIQVATPRPDGSIIHVVRWGQFLENIAKAYNIPLTELLALNGLNQDTVIYEGDKLLIRAAGTVMPTITEGATKTPRSALRSASTPTSTGRPSLSSPSEQSLALAIQTAPTWTAARVAQGNVNSSGGSRGPDYLLIAMISLAVSGLSLVLLGSALKRTGV